MTEYPKFFQMRNTVPFYSVHKAGGSHAPHFSLSFFVGAGLKFHFHLYFISGAVPGEGSSPLSCRKYLWTANPVFSKIYAHKWLCAAVCGHNIFFVSVSWCARQESNLHSSRNWNLNPTRLPVPPRAHIKFSAYF